MRSQARLLVGLIVTVAAISVSTDAHAFGRPKPVPNPMPSASPSPQPSPAPSAEPSPTPSPTPSPSPLPPLPIQIGQIAVGGAGCPEAVTEVEPSADLRTFTVKTPAFFTALQAGSTLARAACTIAIPVGAIPAGTRLVIAEASANGTYSLARSATGKATFEAFFAGQMSDPAVLPVGPGDAAQGILALLKENVALGTCGQDEIVRVNTTLMLTQPAATDASSMGFSVIQLRLELAPCDDQL